MNQYILTKQNLEEESSDIAIRETIDNLRTSLTNEDEKKIQQALEALEDAALSMLNDIADSLNGLKSAGLILFEEGKERIQAWEFVNQNPDYDAFERFINDKIEEIKNPKVKAKVEKFIKRKNAEYMYRTKGHFDFLEKLHCDIRSQEKYEHIVVELNPNSPWGNFIIHKYNDNTFLDAYGRNKSVLKRRLLISKILKSLETAEKPIRLKMSIFDHYEAPVEINSQDDEDINETNQFKPESKVRENNLSKINVISKKGTTKLSEFVRRMFREGYIILHTGGRETILIDLKEIEVVAVDRETKERRWIKRTFERYFQDSPMFTFEENIARSINGALYNNEYNIQSLDVIISTFQSIFANESKVKLLKKETMYEWVPESFKYAFEGKNNMSIYDFLTEYKSMIRDDKWINKNPRLDLTTNSLTARTMPNHRIFMDLVISLITKEFYQEKIYGSVITGYKNDLEFLKRATALNGEDTKAVINNRIVNMLRNNTEPGYGIWYNEETKEVEVRYAIIDESTLPDEVKQELKEMKIEGNITLADGTTFMSSFANKVLFAMNRVFEDKQGIVSKFKTLITKDKILNKNGTHRVPFYGLPENKQNSKLAHFMKINRLGEVHFSSAVKIGANRMTEQVVTWDEIEQGKKISIESQTGVRNLSESAWIQDGKTMKKTTGGLLSILLRTFILPELGADIQNKLLDEVKNQVSEFNSEIKKLSENKSLLAKLVRAFNKHHAFNSTTKLAIAYKMANGKNDDFVDIPYVKDYFVSGVLTKMIRDLFKFRQKLGRYPALTPDLGPLTSYREQLIYTGQITEEEAKQYFTNFGFIKEGYCIISEDIWKELKYKKEDKCLVVMVPPAGSQDIKPLQVIGYVEGDGAMIMNVRQSQEISGKDYDFDKILLLKASTSAYAHLWESLKSRNVSTEDAYVEQKKKFEQEITDQQYEEWKVELNNPNLNRTTAVLLQKFGKSSFATKEINFNNPFVFNKFIETLYREHISTVYNVGVIATYFADQKVFVEREAETRRPTSIIREEASAPLPKFRTDGYITYIYERIDTSVTPYKAALLAALTHQSLDWKSSPDIVLYNFNRNNLLKELFKLKDDEAAKMFSSFASKETNDFQSLARTNSEDKNSIAQMLFSVTRAKERQEEIDRQYKEGESFGNSNSTDWTKEERDNFLNELIGFDETAIPQKPGNTFLYNYITELGKIDLMGLKVYDPTRDEEESFRQRFEKGLLAYLTSLQLFTQTKINEQNLRAIEIFCSLLNRIAFANNVPSASFSPILNIRAMYWFSRLLNKPIATEFIIEILKNKAYDISGPTRIFPVHLGRGNCYIGYDIENSELKIARINGTADTLAFHARNGELYIQKFSYKDGVVTNINDPVSFVEFEKKNPDVVKILFGIKDSPDARSEIESLGERVSTNIFSDKNESILSFKYTSQAGISVSQQVINKNAFEFVSSSFFRKLDNFERAKFVVSLYGALDTYTAGTEKQQELKKHIRLQGRNVSLVKSEKEVSSIIGIDPKSFTSSLYGLISKEKNYGIALKRLTSKTAERVPEQVFPKGRTMEEWKQSVTKLELDPTVLKVRLKPNDEIKAIEFEDLQTSEEVEGVIDLNKPYVPKEQQDYIYLKFKNRELANYAPVQALMEFLANTTGEETFIREIEDKITEIMINAANGISTSFISSPETGIL